ncbi:MAG: chemotaxis protein CheX [Vicinamibacterales bacterium]
MSSVTSPAASTPAESRAGLMAALAEVGELSFFGFVDPVEPAAFAALAAAAGPWLCAEIDYRGQDDGVIRVAVPVALARELVQAFIGEPEAEEAGDGIDDLLGEFANMICGLWLTRTRPDQVFALGRPGVSRMPEGWMPPADGDGVAATFNDQPMAVWIARA